jgi:hypothetical protein
MYTVGPNVAITPASTVKSKVIVDETMVKACLLVNAA